MQFLSPKEIRDKNDLVIEPLYIPEWGGWVRIRRICAVERDRFEARLAILRKEGKAGENIRAELAALALCDEHGKRLFSNADVVDLGNKGAAALDRIWDKAAALAKMNDDDVEDAKKNSSSAPSGASTSGSPDTSIAPSANCSSESTPTN